VKSYFWGVHRLVEASKCGFALIEMSDSGSVHSELTPIESEPELMDEVDEWVQLRAHPNYDIQNQYPFQIRKRSNQRIIALIRDNSTGYIRVYIDGRLDGHHRIIARQFLANPDNLLEIDHINHVKDDNHLDNLRWVSCSDNHRNMTSYSGRTVEYFDRLPEGSEPLIEVGGRPVANGFYQLGRNYFIEVLPGKYRRLTATRNHRNSFIVQVRGPDGQRIRICWTP
jgi:hypothetical protein